MSTRKVPWTSQPQVPVGIDWGNPITRGLVRVDNFALLGRDTLGGPIWGTATFTTTDKGVALSEENTGLDQICASPNLHTKIVTGVTVLSLVWRNSRPQASDFYICHGYQTNYNWGLYDSGAADTRWFFLKNASSSVVNANYTTTRTSGWAVMVGAYSQAQGFVRIYENGVQRAQTAQTGQVAQTDYSLTSFTYGGGTGGIYRQPTTLIWNRELSAQEVAIISANPWQIFQPQTRPIFVGLGGGTAGTTYTISPSGSIVYSGSAASVRTRQINPTGQVVYSGTATLIKVNATNIYTISPTGLVTYSGSASLIKVAAANTYTISPSGAITYSGSVTAIRQRTITPTGSITFNGTAIRVSTHVVMPTGSIQFVGSAPLYVPGSYVATTKLPLTGVGN